MLPDKFRCTEPWTTARALSHPDSFHKAEYLRAVLYQLVGGLLRSFALSREPILLSRADDLGQLLLPFFNATPSGLPAYSADPQT